MAGRTDIVRDCYRAYETGDRELIDQHLAPGYRFWSPQDDGIDRATYFERCWPNADHLRLFGLDRVVEADDAVIVSYTAERTDGSRFCNTEVHVFEGDRIVRTEVYFGWNIT